MRRRAGMTQEELADVLGVDRRTIGRWESGLYPVPRMALHTIELIFMDHREKHSKK